MEIPDNWPDWPEELLEYLGHCPVCKCNGRTELYRDLIDRWFHAPGRWTLHRCDGCASCYIDPRPNRESIGIAYRNYETHRPVNNTVDMEGLAVRLRNGYLNSKYGYRMQPASRIGPIAMRLLPAPLRLEWDHFARHLPMPSPNRNKLLDVGCGNGEFLARARWQGWDVQGIDADPNALEHARRAGIHVKQGLAELDQFDECSFDQITSHQVIEHAHDPLNFIHSLYTWLKPGGRVWLGTPNATSSLHREFGRDWYDLHPPQHLVIFSANALIAAMESAGFSHVELLPRGYLDSHLYRQSQVLRDTDAVGSWESLHQATARPTPITKQITLEARAWLRPSDCSDLIAVGLKP